MKYYEQFVIDDKRYIILEYIDGKDIQYFMTDENSKTPMEYYVPTYIGIKIHS